MLTSAAYSIANFRGPLVKELVLRGVQVYALAPDYDDKTRCTVRGLGAQPIDISLERTGMNVVRDAADALRLVALLRKLKPDAILSYFIKPVIYGSIAATIAGVPRRCALVAGLGYVYTEPGTVRRKLLQLVTSFLYGLAFHVCHQVFVQNDDDLQFFIRNGMISPGKIASVGGSGVDLAEWPPAAQILRPPTFLLMGRLLRTKGIVEYVEAARVVRSRYPAARFLLVGGLDSNPDGLTRTQVESWAREGVIEWIDHVDDVRPWIAQSSVYVLPSYREGKPRSTQEAMAMARPVITTDVPGCRETVLPGVNGFLVPVRDSAALASAMMRFIDEPELIERMGQESRRLAEDWFDARKLNEITLRALGVQGGESWTVSGVTASKV